MAERTRSNFGPILLGGLASAALLAISASQTWLYAKADATGLPVTAKVSGSDAAPLALALGLVALASWGVILVSRTTMRRIAAAIGIVAVLGVLVVVVGLHAHSIAAERLNTQGAQTVSSLTRRPWYYLTGVAAVAELIMLAGAVRFAPTWPTMSSRYDAPGDPLEPAAAKPQPDEDLAGLALWKALDEGVDPTQAQPREDVSQTGDVPAPEQAGPASP
ncbi:MAG TPA: Trp biosynthesis-associated membrane protein [Marmoricola sp.]|nr:Trp biosynthesis-associated membrane protein [Marmoricola sp.]